MIKLSSIKCWSNLSTLKTGHSLSCRQANTWWSGPYIIWAARSYLFGNTLDCLTLTYLMQAPQARINHALSASSIITSLLDIFLLKNIWETEKPDSRRELCVTRWQKSCVQKNWKSGKLLMRASCVCVCDQEVVMCTTVRCLDKYNMHKSDCCTKFEAWTWSLHKVEWWWNVNADDAEQVRGLS